MPREFGSEIGELVLRQATALVAGCFLPPDQKQEYQRLLAARTAALE